MINEKFTEGSDPITDMGIGMNKERIEAVVNEKIENLSDDDINDILEKADELAQDLGSAFEIYFSEDQKLELYFLYELIGAGNIKIKWVDTEDNVPQRLQYTGDYRDIFDYLYYKKIQPLLDKGWEIYYEEEVNDEITEYILVKYKLKSSKSRYVKEDMGGVSAPMTTLVNTPGMGTATPPPTADGNSIGSGDKWGNTIGGKPYTQGGKVKTKKKKPIKKKSKPNLEEENINPYDKIKLVREHL